MSTPAIETPPRDPTSGKFTKADQGGTAVQEPPVKPAAEKPSKEKAAAEQSGLRTFFEQHLHKKPKEPEAPPEKTPEEKKAEEAQKQKREQRRARQAPAAAPAPPREIPTAKEIGDAVREAIQPKVEKKDETEQKLEDGLTDDEKDTLQVIREMAVLTPEKYKDLPSKFAAGQKELKKYAQQWEKDHPGEEFDIQAEEHAEFVEKHNPDWTDSDYSKAERSLIKKEVRDEVTKDVQPKLTEIEQRERMRDAAPIIHQEAIEGARKFWSELEGEYKAVLNADGSVNDEVLNKIMASDPDGYEEVMKVAKNMNIEIAELRKLFPMDDGKGSLVKFNPANPVHKAIDEFLVELEKIILSLPADKQVNEDGDTYLPSDKFYELPKEQRVGKWTMTFREAKDALILDRAEKVKKTLQIMEEKFLQRAKARNLMPNGDPSSGTTRQPTPPPADRTRNGTEEKPGGPSSAATSRMAASVRSTVDKDKTAGSSFLSHHFGRKL